MSTFSLKKYLEKTGSGSGLSVSAAIVTEDYFPVIVAAEQLVQELYNNLVIIGKVPAPVVLDMLPDSQKVLIAALHKTGRCTNCFKEKT